jgi:hypothetical protein
VRDTFLKIWNEDHTPSLKMFKNTLCPKIRYAASLGKEFLTFKRHFIVKATVTIYPLAQLYLRWLKSSAIPL